MGRGPTLHSSFTSSILCKSTFKRPRSENEGQIIFSSNRDGNYNLYIINAEICVIDIDGKDFCRVTNNPGFDTHPHWTIIPSGGNNNK